MPPRISLPPPRGISSTTSPLNLPRRQFSFSAVHLADATEEPKASKIKLDAIKKEYRNFIINGYGQEFEKPLPDNTNYISGPTSTDAKQPFPHNRDFKAPPVLSDEVREEIYRRVVGGKSVRHVSAELGVSLERVAAVVRLKAVEKEWYKEKKPVATFLTKALHSMMPVTELNNRGQARHENTMDLPVHPFSHRQAFVPVSESRTFTRADAAKEFGLPPPEEIVQQPNLVALERDMLNGVDRSVRIQKQIENDRLEMVQRREVERVRAEKERETQIVDSGRWRWSLKPAKAGQVGLRYGVPHQDRKKGQIKIPRKVE